MTLSAIPSSSSSNGYSSRFANLPPIPSLPAVQKAKARKKLSDYIRQGWSTVLPTTEYRHNWHIDAISEHLEAVSRGQILRLVINVAPRSMKSLECSVFWPTWDWIDTPGRRIIGGSYKQTLATRDAVNSRRLIDSPWYQGNWGCRCPSGTPHLDTCKGFRFQGDQNAKMLYENDRGGRRMAVSMVPGPLGDGGDILLADDPHNPEESRSLAALEKAIDAWDTTWLGRLNDPKRSAIVVVMQRLHEKDLTGHALSDMGYTHLCIPTEYEDPPRVSVTSIGWSDPRTEIGQPMWEERMGPEEIEAEKRRGSYIYASQHQQRPAPIGGLIFRTEHWRFWYPNGTTPPAPYRTRLADGTSHLHQQMELPSRFDEEIDSWDMAFKDERSSSYVVGGAWARKDGRKFLLDQKRAKMAFTESVRAVVAMRRERPGATIIIEDKANGPAIIDVLKRKLERVIAIQPDGSKEARAHAVTDDCEAGDVYLPHPSLFPWVEGFMMELAQFPKGEYNDQVDQTTQALRRFQRRAGIGSGAGIESAGKVISRPEAFAAAPRPARDDDFDSEEDVDRFLGAMTL